MLEENEVEQAAQEAIQKIDQAGLILGTFNMPTGRSDEWQIQFWLGKVSRKLELVLPDRKNAVGIIESQLREELPEWRRLAGL
ncbi:hypothetical protein MYX82_03825 [Acidobacteria bacterium AH-259-D05]|nr:hypothetical protein [Acidobacteria bacterium AH-259-D05]